MILDKVLEMNMDYIKRMQAACAFQYKSLDVDVKYKYASRHLRLHQRPNMIKVTFVIKVLYKRWP